MAKNYTVGLDYDTYTQLRDLALINRTSIRNQLIMLVEPEYEKNKDSISKVKGVLDLINPIQEVTPNTIAKEA